MWRIYLRSNRGGLVLLLTLLASAPLRAQIITTAAGDSTWSSVRDVAADAQNNLYVADGGKRQIYKVDRLGVQTIIAGTGANGSSGDGGPATSATFRYPSGIAVAADGTIYIADVSSHNVRKINLNGVITTVAGTGSAGFTGDGGPAAAARLDDPYDVALDPLGNVYIADTGNYRVRRVDTSGAITTIAGMGSSRFSGDGGPARLAGVGPRQLQWWKDSLYIADDNGFSDAANRIRVIGTDGIIRTIAGDGRFSDSGDGGPATSAAFDGIAGVAVDSAGNVYASSRRGNMVRKISTNGIITTYAGGVRSGYSGDGGPAAAALLYAPIGLAIDAQGNLLITDNGNYRIRRVSLPSRPSLLSGVASFLGKADFSSNTYLELYGRDLANVTRTWRASDFTNGVAPTRLEGVSVEVNGKPAYVYFISPSQININTPDDTATGPVLIRITNENGTSDPMTQTRDKVSPALQSVAQFSRAGRQYVVAQTPDFSRFIGPDDLVANVPFTQARSGDTVIIYALGCGPTTPATPAGRPASQNSELASPYEIRIGGTIATVTFAGITQGTIGLYQFNVVIPNVAAGDQSIELTVDGVPNRQNLYISVGQAN